MADGTTDAPADPMSLLEYAIKQVDNAPSWDHRGKGYDYENMTLKVTEWEKNIPARYTDAIFPNLDSGQSPNTLRDWLYDDSLQTLILAGDVGAGKTFAAWAVLNEALIRYTMDVANCAQLETGPPQMWWVNDLLDELRGGDEKDPYALGKARQCDMLGVDDLGITPLTNWESGRIISILNYRINAGYKQVLTSNGSWAELVAMFGPAMMDRVKQSCIVVEITGDSRRTTRPDRSFPRPKRRTEPMRHFVPQLPGVDASL